MNTPTPVIIDRRRNSDAVEIDQDTTLAVTPEKPTAPVEAPPQKIVTAYFPINDRIVVRRMAEDEITAGGLIIPDVGKEKPQQGIVLATGPGAIHPMTGERLPIAVKVGDNILFGKYAGTEVEINHDMLLIMRDEEVLMIIQLEDAPERTPLTEDDDPGSDARS